MQLNPLKRLGCGAKGSNIDFDSLKKHPFFDGLNFERLEKGQIKPPIPVDLFKNATELPEEEEKMMIDAESMDLFVQP